MANITMCCNNGGCKKKETCYRHLAKPSKWQSFSQFFYKLHKECEHYWEILPEKKVNIKRGEV